MICLYSFCFFRLTLKDSKGVTDVMSLLDEFAMELAADLEKRSPTSDENATIDVETDNVGKLAIFTYAVINGPK